MKIRWFGEAYEDLVEIKNFIEKDNPVAAREMAQRIKQSVDGLKDYPGKGRPGRVDGTRELVVPGLPYIIPYRVKKNAVEILRVLHGSMEWPEEI